MWIIAEIKTFHNHISNLTLYLFISPYIWRHIQCFTFCFRYWLCYGKVRTYNTRQPVRQFWNLTWNFLLYPQLALIYCATIPLFSILYNAEHNSEWTKILLEYNGKIYAYRIDIEWTNSESIMLRSGDIHK